MARLQDEVSDVNEDGNVGLGCAVGRLEALDCLQLIQNSEETKQNNICHLNMFHQKVIKGLQECKQSLPSDLWNVGVCWFSTKRLFF